MLMNDGTMFLAGGNDAPGEFGLDKLTTGVFTVLMCRGDVPEDLYDGLLERGHEERPFGIEPFNGVLLVVEGTISELRRQIADSLDVPITKVNVGHGQIRPMQVDEHQIFIEVAP